MTDVTTNLLDGQLGNILNLLSAAAGLGVAAMGLVDASKALGGGPSNFGFGHVEAAIAPFLPSGPAGFGRDDILVTLRANWINGVDKADQKAKAKALIHLGLTAGSAAQLAAAAGVDPVRLTSLAQKVAAGANPTQDELNVLGQFDVVVSAALDAAYERGDQKYRNACKLCATAVATALAVIAGWIIHARGLAPGGAASFADYVSTSDFDIALIIGLGATPLAPVAKDLASALQAAAAAVGAGRP